ncbi:hypothetical protein Angca_004720 [Angiostrongylus cantonensis]|nr:hypothetical protein Angca_004720 [Angiostrongylus cantonensis]
MMRSEVLLLHNLFAVLVATWPEQVHLAFHGDYSVMAVLWTTFHYDRMTVRFGTTPSDLRFTATNDGVKRWQSGSSIRYSHRAAMRNLQPSTTYYYQIGGRQFSFKTLARNPQTYKVCIFGDLGYFHGNSTQSLIRNGLAGKFDFIVHLGDIAYDLHANNGTTGDKYMNQLEPLLSKIPYMVIAGNHEDDGKNFTDYQERFWMPDNDYHDNQFYSCHICAGNENFRAQNSPSILDKFQNPKTKLKIRIGWLEMPGLEPLFLKYGVDMGFWGHEHSYERFYPIANKQFWNGTGAYHNPNAPVYVISGSAAKSYMGCHTPYAKFSDHPWPFSAARINDYGYSILTVMNSTHLHLEQISIEKNDLVVDDLWIVKDNHHVHSQELRQATSRCLTEEYPVRCETKTPPRQEEQLWTIDKDRWL